MRHFRKEYPTRPLNSKSGEQIKWDIMTPSIGVIALDEKDPLVAELDECVRLEQHGVHAISAEEFAGWAKKKKPLPDWVIRSNRRRWDRQELGGTVAPDTAKGLNRGKVDAAADAKTKPVEAPKPEMTSTPAPTTQTRGPAAPPQTKAEAAGKQ